MLEAEVYGQVAREGLIEAAGDGEHAGQDEIAFTGTVVNQVAVALAVADGNAVTSEGGVDIEGESVIEGEPDGDEYLEKQLCTGRVCRDGTPNESAGDNVRMHLSWYEPYSWRGGTVRRVCPQAGYRTEVLEVQGIRDYLLAEARLRWAAGTGLAWNPR